MYQIMIEIAEVDYSSVAAKFLPNMGNMSENMIKGILNRMSEETKNDIAVNIITFSKDKILNKLDEVLKTKQIDITLRSVYAERSMSESAVNLNIVIEKIGYMSVIEKVYGKIAEKDIEDEFTVRMINIFDRIPRDLIEEFIERIPEDVKDELTILLLSEFKGYLTDVINRVASEENIKIKISKIDFIII